MTRLLLVVVFLAALALAGPPAVRIIARGARVGPRTDEDAEGVVTLGGRRILARELAGRAGVELDAYSLARMIASEHGSDSELIRRATAHAARNTARRRGGSVTELLTGGRHAGHYGRQSLGGRWASTRVDPRAGDVALAGDVIAGRDPDPTAGATNFFSPRAQRALAALEPARWDPPDEVDRRWRARGLVPVALAGVDRDLVTFYRPG